MRKNFVRIATIAIALVATLTALSSTANAAPAATRTSVAPVGFVAVPATNQVGCAGRWDFWQLWTSYHGYPACYANAGTVYYGDDPPNTTWTSSDVCSGDNTGTMAFYFWRSDLNQWLRTSLYLAWGMCYDLESMYGGLVEVEGFTIY